MTTHWMKKTSVGLEPVDGSVLPRSKVGDVLRVKISQPRNGNHHAKYWVLVNKIFDNQNYLSTPEKLHQAIKCGTGYGETKHRKNGDPYTVYDSISFGAMEQEEFNQYYDRVLDFICSEILPYIEKEEFKKDIEEFLT